jgi:hypothetical protein
LNFNLLARKRRFQHSGNTLKKGVRAISEPGDSMTHLERLQTGFDDGRDTPCSIPGGNANPWKKVWEKLLQRSDFLTNENQTNWCGQTHSSGARRDQLGAGVREANAKIQFGGDFGRLDRPGDIDRTFIRHLVGFSKAAGALLKSRSERQERMEKPTKAELLAWIEQHQPVTREKLLGAFEDMDYEQLQGWLSELQRKRKLFEVNPETYYTIIEPPGYRRE